MDHVGQQAALEVERAVAEQRGAGRVQEGTAAFLVEPEDAFAAGGQQQRETVAAFIELAFAARQFFARQGFGGGVAQDLGVAAQRAALVAQRHRHAVGKKARAVAAHVPAAVLGAALLERALGLALGLAGGAVF